LAGQSIILLILLSSSRQSIMYRQHPAFSVYEGQWEKTVLKVWIHQSRKGKDILVISVTRCE